MHVRTERCLTKALFDDVAVVTVLATLTGTGALGAVLKRRLPVSFAVALVNQCVGNFLCHSFAHVLPACCCAVAMCRHATMQRPTENL
jgi:hypothetical protein